MVQESYFRAQNPEKWVRQYTELERHHYVSGLLRLLRGDRGSEGDIAFDYVSDSWWRSYLASSERESGLSLTIEEFLCLPRHIVCKFDAYEYVREILKFGLYSHMPPWTILSEVNPANVMAEIIVMRESERRGRS